MSWLLRFFGIVLFGAVHFVGVTQVTGVWSTGAGATWTSSAGAINVTIAASNYGSGTSFTMNDFLTNDFMACAGAYSDPAVNGNPSLSIRHTFPGSATLTITFSDYVKDPVLHFDRLGGGGGAGSTTTSSTIQVITSGITFTELAGNDTHFQTTATTVTRESGTVFVSAPSECGPPTAGTASGSVRLNGTFISVQLQVLMNPANPATVNDRWEIALTELILIDSDGDGIGDLTDIDDDNDGIPDSMESGDFDMDGVADSLDLDSDNDGIFDLIEAGHSALDIDSNGIIDGLPVAFGSNGLYDGLETLADNGILNYTGLDSDTDGFLDAQELDSDNDGCNDVLEAGYSDADKDGVLGSSPIAVDGNGLVVPIP